MGVCVCVGRGRYQRRGSLNSPERKVYQGAELRGFDRDTLQVSEFSFVQ